jgi:hypothetical protein
MLANQLITMRILKLLMVYPLYVIAVAMFLVSAVIVQASALLMDITDNAIRKTRVQQQLSPMVQTP